MASERFIKVLIPGIIAVYLCSCKPTDVILHGEITGKVTDATTHSAIENASVKLGQSNDSTNTDANGNYLLTNLIPRIYDIHVTKTGYASVAKNITVISAETQVSDILLNGTPQPIVNTSYLDFGLDSTKLLFTISNSGNGKFTYILVPSQDWVNVDKPTGDITNITDSISVTIKREGLSDTKYIEAIRVICFGDNGTLYDNSINVYLNGVLDADHNYYTVVKIGTQTWMAENLKVGTPINGSHNQIDNRITELYLYGNDANNYNIYGGLYQWNEMMQYMPPDEKPIGTTQGICPVGWHIPTQNEWQTLVNLLGGLPSGGKMKETGFAHWNSPNTGATNESKFSGLPGGLFGYYRGNDPFYREFNFLHTNGVWWSSSLYPSYTDGYIAWGLNFDDVSIDWTNWSYSSLQGCSVRCVKDQP